MKNNRTVQVLFLAGALLLASCASSKKTQGTIIGAGAGAAIGAGVGAIFGKGKGAAIGATIGGIVGAGAGAAIGKKMDKQQAELEAIEGAQVEQITDANGLPGLVVTFDSGILFPTNGSTLNEESRRSLAKFANSLMNNPDTDVTIYGHTDNTGSRRVNERISKERAESVSTFLTGKGIASRRIHTEGKAYDMPVASNDTAAGRAQNRRVEVYLTANEKMINDHQ